MAKIIEKSAHEAELVDERGVPFATIQFNAKTNAASRREILLDGAEHWCNGGEGTPEFRLASRLRALLNVRLSQNESTNSRQQLTERKLATSLKDYIEFFRNPENQSRRRDPSLPQQRKPQQQYRPPMYRKKP